MARKSVQIMSDKTCPPAIGMQLRIARADTAGREIFVSRDASSVYQRIGVLCSIIQYVAENCIFGSGDEGI
jgi:hypothetical protein